MNKKSKLSHNLDAVNDVFHAIDLLRADVKKCGRFLKDVDRKLNITVFDCDNNHMTCIYGLQKETVKEILNVGDKAVNVPKNDYFIEGRRVLIFNLQRKNHEYAAIKEVRGNTLILSKGLQNHYPAGSFIVAVRQVDYKRSVYHQVVKRRIDNGRFLPVLYRATGFSLTRFPDSLNVYFGIEVNNEVQVNGYIFLGELL